jgi:hypothetical protein
MAIESAALRHRETKPFLGADHSRLATDVPNVGLLPPTRRLCGFKLKGALQQRYSAYNLFPSFCD